MKNKVAMRMMIKQILKVINLLNYSLANMSHRKSKSPLRQSDYIFHPLNLSKTKSVFSFERSSRFPQEKSYSPNKFYDIPSSFKRNGFSLGVGTRTKFEKPDFVEPTRYKIVSEFEPKAHHRSTSDTFGISRESYYRGKTDKIEVGPGTYNISRELSTKNIYIGQKLKTLSDKSHVTSQINITNTALNRLSTYRNDPTPIRLKTEYYPKAKLFEYDNKVPGPGAYLNENRFERDHKQHASEKYSDYLRRIAKVENRQTQPSGTREIVKMRIFSNIFSEFGCPK